MQPGVAMLLWNVSAKAGSRFTPVLRAPVISVAVLDVEVIGIVANVVFRRRDHLRFGVFAFNHGSIRRDLLVMVVAAGPFHTKIVDAIDGEPRTAIVAGRSRVSNGLLPESYWPRSWHEDCGAFEPSGAEIGEGLIRLVERIGRGLGHDADLGR